MVAKNLERLRGMATLPMQNPDAAISELERVVKAGQGAELTAHERECVCCGTA
jgi:hypothetical protein